MRLTKQTGHAIRILIHCAEAGDTLIKTAEISNHLDITKQNVFKIVFILSRAGFISAMRGPSGGVKLAKPAAQIRIGDVVRAIEVTDVEIDGESGAAIAPERGSGSINRVFDDAMTAFVSVLDQHTLADLIQQRRSTSAASASQKSASGGRGGKSPRAAKKAAGTPRR